jgi:hypothetical protein
MWARRGLPELGVDPLGDDDLWHHPLLVAHQDLREELRRLAEIVPDLLDRLDALPQAMPHGDASPQNLLVPADAPDTFVAIDISFQTPLALGHDLGQLLVGLVHAGVRPATALPELHPVLLDNYARGVADQGVKVSVADIELGYVGSLLIRSGFTALPYGNLGPATPERLALTRFIVDTAKPLVT